MSTGQKSGMKFFEYFWKGSGNPSHPDPVEDPNNASVTIQKSYITSEDKSCPSQGNVGNDEGKVDPKVAEFFKDFPEPYRQKAIERFSKREGLQKYEFFREMEMNREMKAALSGIFLEDRREHEEYMKKLNAEERKAAYQNIKENFLKRDIPRWEQEVLKYVPLQPGDQMWAKLFTSTNISVIGGAFLYKWYTFQKQTPRPSSSKLIRTFIGSCGLFCCMQFIAVSKLMDWGVFDKTSDERHYIVKTVEWCKSDLKTIQKYLEEIGEQPPNR